MKLIAKKVKMITGMSIDRVLVANSHCGVGTSSGWVMSKYIPVEIIPNITPTITGLTKNFAWLFGTLSTSTMCFLGSMTWLFTRYISPVSASSLMNPSTSYSSYFFLTSPIEWVCKSSIMCFPSSSISAWLLVCS